MADFCWNDESIEELLDSDIGEIREMLAYEDADKTFREFLVDGGYIDENRDEDEDDDNWDDDEEDDEDTELPSEEEELAHNIARDIDEDLYTIDTIIPLYNNELVNRVRELL